MSEEFNQPLNITLQLTLQSCNIMQELRELGVRKPILIDLRRMSNGAIRHLFRISNEEISAGLSARLRLTRARKRSNHLLVWLDNQDCLACRTIVSHSALQITGTSINSSSIRYYFIVPDHMTFQRMMTAFEIIGVYPRLLDLNYKVIQSKTLTCKQERAFWYARTFGFFEWPRRLTLTDLANELGISASTLCEQLRRGTRRLIDNYYTQIEV